VAFDDTSRTVSRESSQLSTELGADHLIDGALDLEAQEWQQG
jgi:hypothetical protein